MLVQWKPNESGHNFGDYLSILFERIFEAETWKQIIDDPATDYYLVGSVLDDYYCDVPVSLAAMLHFLDAAFAEIF